MANRRMFSKTVTDSDAFTALPLTSQALYFHLGLAADDDGVVNAPKRIQRSIGASDDDLRLLAAKGFLIPFPTGLVVLTHWRVNNYLRSDRYTPTAYQDEWGQLTIGDNGLYSLASPGERAPGVPVGAPSGIPTGNPVKIRSGETREEYPTSGKPDSAAIIREVVEYLNASTGKHFKPTAKATARHINARLVEGYALADFRKVIDVKARQWGNDPRMVAYLRPETLFGPKFEGYINEGAGVQDAECFAAYR